jgi:hypothetical protein
MPPDEEATTSRSRSLEGFIAAKVLVKDCAAPVPTLPARGFIAAMEGMRDVDVGGFTVTFTPTSHSGSRFVELTVIGKDERFLR